MDKSALPRAEAVSKLIGELLDRSVKAKTANEAPADQKGSTVALYTSGDGPAVICVSDLSLAAHAGAALSLVPAGRAEDCVNTGELDEALGENFGEVLNVASQLFNQPNAPRVALRSVHFPSEELPGDVSKLMKKPAARVDLQVEIDGYGGGTLSFLAV